MVGTRAEVQAYLALELKNICIFDDGAQRTGPLCGFRDEGDDLCGFGF